MAKTGKIVTLTANCEKTIQADVVVNLSPLDILSQVAVPQTSQPPTSKASEGRMRGRGD